LKIVCKLLNNLEARRRSYYARSKKRLGHYEFGSKYIRLGLFVASVLVPGYEFFVAAFRGLSGVIGNFK
jgi:hypothetical protein